MACWSGRLEIRKVRSVLTFRDQVAVMRILRLRVLHAGAGNEIFLPGQDQVFAQTKASLRHLAWLVKQNFWDRPAALHLPDVLQSELPARFLFGISQGPARGQNLFHQAHGEMAGLLNIGDSLQELSKSFYALLLGRIEGALLESLVQLVVQPVGDLIGHMVDLGVGDVSEQVGIAGHCHRARRGGRLRVHDPLLGWRQVNLGVVRVNQDAAGFICDVELVAIGVGAQVFPATASAVRLPVVDLHAIKTAGGLRYGTREDLGALRFAVDVDKAHRHAPDRHPRRVFQHLVFPEAANALVERVNPHTHPEKQCPARIRMTAHVVGMLADGFTPGKGTFPRPLQAHGRHPLGRG